MKPETRELLRDEFREEIELVKGACPELSIDDYLAAKQTPVFFGSAIGNFGVKELLDEFVNYAPAPLNRESEQREVLPGEEKIVEFEFDFPYLKQGNYSFSPAVAEGTQLDHVQHHWVHDAFIVRVASTHPAANLGNYIVLRDQIDIRIS